MQIARTRDDLDRALAALRTDRRGLGFVPTMGALHAGHLALLAAARAECGATAASIFVNPLQFGPNEDFARYPRDEDGDLAALRRGGCDLVWLPDVATMYPTGSATQIEVAGPAEGWEGAIRPGHFRGVATVCARLFGQVGPTHAYFGEKDWQQVQVVRRVVADLALPLRIVAVPTVREPDGLALSSRNRYLAPEERERAPLLHRTMQEAAAAIRGGADVVDALGIGRARLTQAGFQPDYLAVVDGTTMLAVERAQARTRLIAAARLGPVRLLDNIPVAATTAGDAG